MNSNQVIEILNEICNKLGIAVDWTSENILPQVKIVCEKLVKYFIVQRSIMCSFGFLFVCVVIAYGISLLKQFLQCRTTGKDNFLFVYYKLSDSTDLQSYTWIINVIAIVIGLTGIILLGLGLPQLIKWLTVPEIAIIEYLTDMIKGVS